MFHDRHDLPNRQLQEKCREQKKPPYITFIDLTKSFDLVSRDCKDWLPTLALQSFHTDIEDTLQFHGSSSDAFGIYSGVKQEGILAPTLLGIEACLCTHVLRSLPSHKLA